MKYRALILCWVVSSCWVVSFGLAGCSQQATGGTETGNTLGAVITSLFSDEGQNASLQIAMRIRQVSNRTKDSEESGRETTCEVIANSDDAVDDVGASGVVTAGTYGTSSHSVTVASADGCDEGGEYASFHVTSHELECADLGGNAIVVTMTDSTGVWRENLETLQTEIYGTFTITSASGTASGVQCYLTIDHSSEEAEGLFDGECEDEIGQMIEQSSSFVCQDNE